MLQWNGCRGVMPALSSFHHRPPSSCLLTAGMKGRMNDSRLVIKGRFIWGSNVTAVMLMLKVFRSTSASFLSGNAVSLCLWVPKKTKTRLNLRNQTQPNKRRQESVWAHEPDVPRLSSKVKRCNKTYRCVCTQYIRAAAGPCLCTVCLCYIQQLVICI